MSCVIPDISPIELYTRSKEVLSELKNERTWGLPAYVLNPKLQDGKKFPKWDFRTRQGQYLGKSPKYASSISLIINLYTDFISPQFCVIYNNSFYTLYDGYEDNKAVVDHIWDNLYAEENNNVAENVVGQTPDQRSYQRERPDP